MPGLKAIKILCRCPILMNGFKLITILCIICACQLDAVRIPRKRVFAKEDLGLLQLLYKASCACSRKIRQAKNSLCVKMASKVLILPDKIISGIKHLGMLYDPRNPKRFAIAGIVTGTLVSMYFRKSIANKIMSWAVARNNRRLLGLAFLLGADLHKAAPSDDSLLAIAISRHNYTMATYLVEHGARVTWPIISLAIKVNYGGDFALVRYLVGHSLRIKDKETSGYLLRAAIDKASLPIIAILVEQGADVNVVWGNGVQATQSLLLYAVMYSTQEIVQYLVEHGADVDCCCLIDGERKTSLSLAIEKGKDSVVWFLVEHGAIVNAESCPLYVAARVGALRIVEYLIAKGAYINGSGSHNPLMAAAAYGHEDIVRYLVYRGAHDKLDDAFAQALGNGHRDIALFLRSVIQKEEAEKRQREFERQQQREQEEQRRRAQEEAEKRQREFERQQQREQDEQPQSEIEEHRSWLTEHIVTVKNMDFPTLNFLASALEGTMKEFVDHDSRSNRRRWELVRDTIEKLLPAEHRRRISLLPDKTRYHFLARMFHSDKVKPINSDLVPYTERIFKILGQAYSELTAA